MENGSLHIRNDNEYFNAESNQLSMYEHFVKDNTAKFYLTERNIYGSSRLRTTKDTLNIFVPSVLPSYGILGNRTYELSNHLGNVLTTISDIKYPLSDDNVSISGYEVGINGISDYSPFGAPLDGRTVGKLGKRGFNGMEKDDEWKGGGNSLNTEWRQYDSRFARWISPDPLIAKFPAWSPYVFAFDNPIWFNDPDGDVPPTIKQIIAEGKKTSATFSVLLNIAKITDANYSKNISFGSGTYTENKTGKIVLTKSEDIKFQVIKLTHELTNRKNIAKIQKIDKNVAEGKITTKEYAKQLAQIEVEGEINQIKVAAETGYRYKGKGTESLNKLIDDYSKDKTIDLTKRVIAGSEHLKKYEKQGERIRADQIKKDANIEN